MEFQPGLRSELGHAVIGAILILLRFFRAEISAQGRHVTLLPPAGLDPFPPEKGRIKLNFNFLFGLC